MSLLTEIRTFMDASGLRFSTGYFDTSCKNRLRDSEDYIAVIPLSTVVEYADDAPACIIESARIIIYTPGTWTGLQQQIYFGLLAAGFYVSSMDYGGYDETDHRHAYNVDVAKPYDYNPTESED